MSFGFAKRHLVFRFSRVIYGLMTFGFAKSHLDGAGKTGLRILVLLHSGSGSRRFFKTPAASRE